MGMFAEIENARMAKMLEDALLPSLREDVGQDVFYYCQTHIYPVYKDCCLEGYAEQNVDIRRAYDVKTEVKEYEKPKENAFYKDALKRGMEE